MEAEGSIPSTPTLDQVSIIYEDRNFIAVNKPAGLLVHKTVKGEGPTLVDWLTARYPELKTVGDDPKARPGIVHRLDKETSGILLVAKTQECFDYLKLLFKNQEIKKTYLALVLGRVTPKTGVIDKPIGLKTGTVKRTVHSKKLLKEATTAYRVLEYSKNKDNEFSFLELRPQTGRTHQLRVHLASINHPIVGDRLYGRKLQPKWVSRLMLHAYSLEFSPLQGGRLKLEAESPEDFQSIMHNLKNFYML